jgi:hypothetical protein
MGAGNLDFSLSVLARMHRTKSKEALMQVLKDFLDENQLAGLPGESAWNRLRWRIGRWVAYFYDPVAQQTALESHYAVWKARSPGNRMSEDELRSYLSVDLFPDSFTAEQVADFSWLEPAALGSIQGQVAPMLAKLLEIDPSISSVTNVGAYNGFIDYYFAKRFPAIRFTGVDFWRNIVEHNRMLVLPNLEFRQGYALDLLEKGIGHSDVVFFSSTAARIKNAELHRYLSSISGFAKYLILNEPIFRLPGDKLVSPDDVDPKESIPGLVYPIYAGDRFGGYPPCLLHNYRSIVSDHFEVVHYFVSGPQSKPEPRVHVIGRRKGYVPVASS